MESAPPTPPSPPTTSGRRVESTCPRMSSTARSPASTSTPAWRYAERPRAPPAGSVTGPRQRVFEDALAHLPVVRDGLRIVAVETREAEPLVGQVERREDATDRQVAQRICPDELLGLVDRVGGRNQLGLERRVDAVEARVVDRRRTDAHVDLACPGAPQQVDGATRARGAAERSVAQH